MPWFKIDDSSHSHPKFVRAGNAALGLWVRCGAYSAQHLLEGVVPGDIAALYGTEPQARKLVKVGLWHQAGHGCARCPQPESGDFVIHDFFEGGRNTTKTQHEANRKAAADRKAKSRASQKASGIADENQIFGDRKEDQKNGFRDANDPQFSDSTAGQSRSSHRDTSDGVTPSHAAAMPYRSTSYGSTAAAAAREGGVDDPLIDLKQRLAAAGLGSVAWDLRETQWLQTRDAVNRVGTPVMVEYAVNSARLKGPPAKASAWIPGWSSLEAPRTGTERPVLKAVSGGYQPYQQPTPDAYENQGGF